MAQSITETSTKELTVSDIINPQYKDIQEYASYSTSFDVFRRGVWDMMLDWFAGDIAVKMRGEDYLPKTGKMIEDTNSTRSNASYRNYLTRAKPPSWLSEVVGQMKGLILSSSPVFNVPTKLEPMVESATLDGSCLESVASDILEKQLTTGRIGAFLPRIHI